MTEVEFEFEGEDPTELRTLLQNQNASDIEVVSEEGLLPILGIVIAALIGINGLITIVTRLTRLWSCGIIVDARTSTIRTKKDCDLPRGAVLVFAVDGTQYRLHEPTETDLAKLIGGPIGKLATS